MTSNADQREADREQKDEEDADADGSRVDLLRQQKFEADIDDPHAIAECKPPRAARGPVGRRDHGERDGKNAGHGHVDPKHESCSHRPTHHRRSEEHTSELQSLMRISYAVFCLKKKTVQNIKKHTTIKYKYRSKSTNSNESLSH